MRGRNRSKGPNPLTRTYESNGPDVKVRGTAQHVADKYAQLARDAQVSGDPVAAENYLQHAEHYYRIILAAQEQLRQQFGGAQRSFDDDVEEGDEETLGGFGYPQGDRNGMPGQVDDLDPGMQPQPYEARGYAPRSDQRDRGPRGERGEYDNRDRPSRRERFGRNGENRGEGRYEGRNGDNRNGDNRYGEGRNGEGRYGGEGRNGDNRGENRDAGGAMEPNRRDVARVDAPRQDALPVADASSMGEGGHEAARSERPARPRRERRREQPAAETGLPAFLTNPAPRPVSYGEEPQPAPAPQPEAEAEGEAAPKPRRTRRRRTAGDEVSAGSDFATNDQTPAE